MLPPFILFYFIIGLGGGSSPSLQVVASWFSSFLPFPHLCAFPG